MWFDIQPRTQIPHIDAEDGFSKHLSRYRLLLKNTFVLDAVSKQSAWSDFPLSSDLAGGAQKPTVFARRGF